MPVRGLLVAVVVLGLLAGGVYWSDRHKAAEEAKEASGGASKLVTLKDEDVRKIEIARRDAAAPLVLERDKSNEWRMTAPETWRVDQSVANGLASTYAGLAYDRIVEEKTSDLVGYGLQPAAVEVTITARDGKTRKFLLGDETPTGSGAFAKFSDEARVFTVTGDTKSQMDKTAKDLRDKRLLVFDADKLARVEVTLKGQLVEFGRNAQKEWQIVKPRPQRADNGQVEELVRKLGDARMDLAAPDEEAAKAAASFGAGSRVATAAVTDSAGTQTLEVRKKGDEYYARSSAVQGTFKVAADLGEALNKTLDDFRNKKLFDFGFSDPSAIEIRDGAKSYSFRKSGEKWTFGGKTADSVGVQSLVDKLRELSAIRFMESPVSAPPILELTVTSDSGKRVEKVSVSKVGDRFLATRAAEPTVYELDGKAVEELQRAAADVKEPPPPAPAKK